MRATPGEKVEVFPLALEVDYAVEFLMAEKLEDELDVLIIQQQLRKILEFEDIWRRSVSFHTALL